MGVDIEAGLLFAITEAAGARWVFLLTITGAYAGGRYGLLGCLLLLELRLLECADLLGEGKLPEPELQPKKRR